MGGLPVAGGGRTRRRALVRADAVDGLSADGWRALVDHGVRTVIDLRNDDEPVADRAPRPAGVRTVRLPHDAAEDTAFWDRWAPTAPPRYYAAHLRAHPERSAGVLRAIADAPPGGVLVHCAVGRDRTGLVVLLALAAVGVEAEAIVADHVLSRERLRARSTALRLADDGEEIDRMLAAEGMTTAEVLRSTLADLDVERLVEPDVLGALRARLVER